MNDVELKTVSNSNQNYAVKVENAYKRFNPFNVVLNGLDMHVPEGCIYGLLGPSGCGKTTLLNCIAGKSKLDSGSIKLKVNKLQCIGYMPQTLSLHTQMTIKESITFYGYLFGMRYDELKNSVNEFVSFLELPDKNRFVGELSEGQKRRVSLIITMIHDPEILILDEPTVGMDVIISDKIWKRLLLMAVNGKTIIITTHYIQEAQQAHKIGLMREGVLLAEESPEVLMERSGCDDLEAVFLQLSKRQDTTTVSHQAYPESRDAICPHFKDDRMFTKEKVRGIFYKDVAILQRGYTFLFFALLIATVTIIIFNAIIGKPPKHLKIGVVNEECSLDKCDLRKIDACFMNDSKSIMFSCLLTDYLRNETYKIKEYRNTADAISDFEKNKIYGVLHFPKNYTQALGRRFFKFMDNFDEKTVNQSILDLWVDTADKYMEMFISMDVLFGMLEFIKRVLSNCHLNPKIVTPPVSVEDPIYGSMDDTFTAYTLVPFIFISSFVWPMVSIAVFFLSEKTSGIMDRVMMTGTSMIDMMSSFFMIQLVLQFFSTLIVLAVIFGLYDYSMDGSMFQFTLLLMMISISGMLFGFFAGMIHADVHALGISLGCFNTILIFVTGIIRPLEESHVVIRTLGHALPISWSIKGLQAIRFKDKNLWESPVLEAFGFNAAFIIIFITVIYVMIKYKKIGCIQCLASVDAPPTAFSLM